jgi:V8-like Glu-specific endopeptidase
MSGTGTPDAAGGARVCYVAVSSPFAMRLLALFVGLAVPLAAQAAVHARVASRPDLDSGWLDNLSAQSALIWSADVLVGGDWSQVRFRDTHLPPGSRLRISGAIAPGRAQWHDARSLRDYRGWSCHLAGPVVQIELWAAAGSRGNRACLDETAGVVFAPGGDSICDGADDRTPSTDERAGRLGFSFCTAWLFSPYALATAGHCTSTGTTAGEVVHFNVPASSGAGVPQPSHPDDQYAFEPFLQFLDNGIGQDWSVMAALRNSNTGLFPGQAQGSWYAIATPPAIVSDDIRITGFGSGNGAGGLPTANYAQKTHAGPRVPTAFVDTLAYRADTTAGNSGSPVIYEPTGEVIGVHTHGGCANGSGENLGTSAARGDFAAARQAALALHTVGAFARQGTGCGGAFGVPELLFSGVPEVGRVFGVHVQSLNPAPGLFGVLVIGFSDQQWHGGALPAPLDPFGLAGCTLFVGDDAVDSLGGSGGSAQRSYLVPTAANFVGARLLYQYLGLDPTAANAAGGVASNAGAVLFGN